MSLVAMRNVYGDVAPGGVEIPTFAPPCHPIAHQVRKAGPSTSNRSDAHSKKSNSMKSSESSDSLSTSTPTSKGAAQFASHRTSVRDTRRSSHSDRSDEGNRNKAQKRHVSNNDNNNGNHRMTSIIDNVHLLENTPVMVSAGDDEWYPGYWRDNTRTVSVFLAALTPDGPVTFVRVADVALNDREGNPMYLAGNRRRPAYICLIDTAAPLYVPSTRGQDLVPTSLEALRAQALDMMRHN